MDTSFFQLPISPKMVQALSWTLLHSLWQGLVLAVLTGGVLLTTRKSKPVLRYNLLVGLLLAFLVVSAGTFWLEYRQAAKTFTLSAYTVSEGTSAENSLLRDSAKIIGAGQEQWLSWLVDLCTQHASTIVLVWFVVFLWKSLKAATGLYYIHRIRHYGLRPVSSTWKQRLLALARRLEIRTGATLAESELVQVPLVVGFLKPVILVPVGFLTNLPYAQVEAILLHELAHIRRKDYLVNLFQTLAGNVFFFHPAVGWLLYLISEEREHCCDDLAIAVTQNKTGFVEALVGFQEYKLTGTAHSLAFAGRRNHLLDRIKRIIFNNNKQLDAMEKVFVVASLLTIAVLSVAFSPTPQAEVPTPPAAPQVVPAPRPAPKPAPVHRPAPAPAPVVAPDTLVPKKEGISSGPSLSTYQVTHEGKWYEIVEQDGKITGLKIDGVTIPEDKIESYRPEIEPVMAQVREHQKQAELHRAQAEVHRQEAREHRRQAEVQGVEADKIRKEAGEHRARADVMRREAEAMRTEAEKHRKEAENMQASSAGARQQADAARRQAEEARREADLHRQQAEVHRREADEQRKKAEAKRAEYEKMQEGFIDEMIREGVIQNKTNLSYKLSQEELIVNGVKQPEAMHRKFRDKYLKELGVEMFYNWEGKRGIMYSR